MNEVRIVGNDLIISVDEVVANMENAALIEDNKRLQSENEKLRELMYKVEHYEQFGCHDCPHDGSCAVDTLYDEGCAMSREIEFEKRKLGIEVDA